MNREADRVDGSEARQLELIVLQQLREGMALVNSNMSRFSEKLDTVHERVMAIELAKFDHRIEETFADAKEDLRRTEKELQRQIDGMQASQVAQELRMRSTEGLIARYGAFLAVIGTVGGAAVAAIATKVFGAG